MSYGRAPAEVVVVTGIGDMGAAGARRLGSGRQVVLADISEGNLARRAEAFRTDGHFVHEMRIDVSNR